jgi:hypothetical protein
VFIKPTVSTETGVFKEKAVSPHNFWLICPGGMLSVRDGKEN